MVNDDHGIGHGGQSCEGVGQAATVTLLQDILTNDICIIHVTRQLAAVHNSRFIITDPASQLGDVLTIAAPWIVSQTDLHQVLTVDQGEVTRVEEHCLDQLQVAITKDFLQVDHWSQFLVSQFWVAVGCWSSLL